mgnify:CR=1 FL=1
MDRDLPIYMIGMSTHLLSLIYSRYVTPSWKGHNLRFFEAVTPKDLYKKTDLVFGVKGSRHFTETEKAVWYSHYELWARCALEGPCVIIEHDSCLVKPLPDLSKDGYKFLSFVNDQPLPRQRLRLAPGSGYYLTPQAAGRLIKNLPRVITVNSDGHLANTLNLRAETQKNDCYYIEQVNWDGLNTIDHKNNNRDYIGLDYENVDISGVHR